MRGRGEMRESKGENEKRERKKRDGIVSFIRAWARGNNKIVLGLLKGDYLGSFGALDRNATEGKSPRNNKSYSMLQKLEIS